MCRFKTLIMKYLFSHKFKKIGWILFGIGVILGIVYILGFQTPEFLQVSTFAIVSTPLVRETQFFSIIENNLFDELIGVFIIVGGLLVAFSKQKYEDEFIAKIRLESLVWAVYVNYSILLISLLFIYGATFFQVMIYNMFTLIIFFLIKFNFELYRIKK